jgi:post-segregation antitoxin (ccd killing protein)
MKRSANVSIDGALLDEAKRHRIDLSRALTSALEKELDEARHRQWIEGTGRHSRAIAGSSSGSGRRPIGNGAWVEPFRIRLDRLMLFQVMRSERCDLVPFLWPPGRHPVRAAARSDAVQTRDRCGRDHLLSVDPGPAVQHCMLHSIRDDAERPWKIVCLAMESDPPQAV